MRPLKARALAELLMKTPDAYVLVDGGTRVARCSRPAPEHEHIAAATRVINLSPTELLICSDEG